MAGVSFLYSFVSPLSIAGPQMIYFTFCQNSGVPPDLELVSYVGSKLPFPSKRSQRRTVIYPTTRTSSKTIQVPKVLHQKQTQCMLADKV